MTTGPLWSDILELAGRREIRGRVTRVGKGAVCVGCSNDMSRGSIGFVLKHAAPRGTIVSSGPITYGGNATPPGYMGMTCPDCMDVLRELRANSCGNSRPAHLVRVPGQDHADSHKLMGVTASGRTVKIAAEDELHGCEHDDSHCEGEDG